MRRYLLLLGMGTALLAANACSAEPSLAAGLLTPLMMAAPDPDPTLVTLLLARGANPRARGVGGSTALTYAVSGGALSDIDRPLLGGCRPKTVEALLAHDPTLVLPDTIAGHNALWWARFHGCDGVLDRVIVKNDRKG
jgi:ankyrin repeat protein